ncbi:MAG: hypothetical protein KAR20_19370 [Candidatus Heimdallarchaeota archaeon]|nr:hypothetical protein [Candidatus Heimdallarchaeota archaeon]
MALKELTFEKRKELLNVSLNIVGVAFDNPNVVELVINVYDRIIEKGGAVGVDELIEIRDEFLKKNPLQNEPSGPKDNKGQK